jgi:hypothetical protein
MSSNKWGVRSIPIREDSFNRISQRLRMRLTSVSARGGWKRVLRGAAILAALGAIGYLAAGQIIGYVGSKRILVSIEEVRRGVGYLAVVRGGQLSGEEADDLLAEMLGRGYLKREILNRVAGYRVTAVTPVEESANEYSITVRCVDELACAKVGTAFQGHQALVARTSRDKNSVTLVFKL